MTIALMGLTILYGREVVVIFMWLTPFQKSRGMGNEMWPGCAQETFWEGFPR